MGRSHGPGSPVAFWCSKCRSTLVNRRNTTVTLTGRTRPYNPPRSMGSRSTFTSREYVCSCGHTGWSNHRDLA